MTAWILTLNSGSSSIKFAVYQVIDERPVEQGRGQIEGLGVQPMLKMSSSAGDVLYDRELRRDVDHNNSISHILELLNKQYSEATISLVGHRVVHGGVKYEKPVIIDDCIIEDLKSLNQLAPLHQPHNIAGINVARIAFPDAIQVACFDTGFHRRHPWVNDTFALPQEYYDKGIRRYGFHGLSYEYVIKHLREIAPEQADGRVIVAHLGNGASMCAIKQGISIGSTMGFSALDGLPMGTRCGQLDPAVVLYLIEQEGLNPEEVSNLLYKQSGLKGLSGLSPDMRTLETSESPEAKQAIDYFVFRIRRELGAMAAILGGIEAIVFCGGIGEHSARIREEVCENFSWMGLELNTELNNQFDTNLSAPAGKVGVYIIKTNEELMIAQHTLECSTVASG